MGNVAPPVCNESQSTRATDQSERAVSPSLLSDADSYSSSPRGLLFALRVRAVKEGKRGFSLFLHTGFSYVPGNIIIIKTPEHRPRYVPGIPTSTLFHPLFFSTFHNPELTLNYTGGKITLLAWWGQIWQQPFCVTKTSIFNAMISNHQQKSIPLA